MRKLSRHWTDPDYGICPVDTIENGSNYVLVRLNSLVNGKVKTINRTLSYSKYGGRDSSIELAREVRNELLAKPEVIDYLNSIYVAPKRQDILIRKNRENTNQVTVPGLNGIYVETVKVNRKGGGVTTYFNAVALCPDVENGTGVIRFRRSLKKHGALKALTMVVNWRADKIGVNPHTDEDIAKASRYVEREFVSSKSAEEDVSPTI